MTESRKAVVTRKCYECSGMMEGQRENYRYTECGLSSVTLVNVLVFHCNCGAIMPELAVEELHYRIALHLVGKDTPSLADEIRFLRKMAGFTVSELAAKMGVGRESVSRWENDKLAIGKESDRFMRLLCFLEIAKRAAPEAGEENEKMLDFARRALALNMPEVIQERQAHGSKTIRLNPEMLSQPDSMLNINDQIIQ